MLRPFFRISFLKFQSENPAPRTTIRVRLTWCLSCLNLGLKRIQVLGVETRAQGPGPSQAVLSLSTVGLHLPARVLPGL